MDIHKEAALINADFASKSEGRIYPFISNNRITVLEKGLYKKMNSNYNGIGVTKDQITKKDKVVLMGYYNVPDNMLIIPTELVLSHSQKDLVERYKQDGYIEVHGFPQLQIVEFKEGTPEYRVAIAKKMEFNKQFLNDTSSNKS